MDRKNDQKCLSFAYVDIYQILAMYLATNQRSRLIDVVRNVILLVRNEMSVRAYPVGKISFEYPQIRLGWQIM